MADESTDQKPSAADDSSEAAAAAQDEADESVAADASDDRPAAFDEPQAGEQASRAEGADGEPAAPSDSAGDEPATAALAPGTGVEIADSVVAKIAYMACRGIDGVHALGGATSRAFSSLRGGEHTTGVSVDLRADSVELDITLVVTYGKSIPQVAQECREAVREQIESITGLKVKAINVVVADIHFPEGGAEPDGAQS
jgi:uncharacterized alkaline shock family protein YloU